MKTHRSGKIGLKVSEIGFVEISLFRITPTFPLLSI